MKKTHGCIRCGAPINANSCKLGADMYVFTGRSSRCVFFAVRAFHSDLDFPRVI